MNTNQEFAVYCGHSRDNLDELKTLCEQEAANLQIEIPDDKIIQVPFWTTDMPELICVGTFRKDETGKTIYELDFSQSTL